MTNVEIIAAAKMANGITEEANTYAFWKKAGAARCLPLILMILSGSTIHMDISLEIRY